MKRLISTAPQLNGRGETLVNYAANRIGGLAVGHAEFSADPGCVRFPNGTRLADRKWLTLTVVQENIPFGPASVTESSGYLVTGAGRDASYRGRPETARYSNRKQFLRGQYLKLAVNQTVVICGSSPTSPEDGHSLEIS